MRPKYNTCKNVPQTKMKPMPKNVFMALILNVWFKSV